MFKWEVLSKLKQKFLLFKAGVPDSFWVVSNVSLGGRVIDTKLWMPGGWFSLCTCLSGCNVVWQS